MAGITVSNESPRAVGGLEEVDGHGILVLKLVWISSWTSREFLAL
jgi:hypothetical protein